MDSTKQRLKSIAVEITRTPELSKDKMNSAVTSLFQIYEEFGVREAVQLLKYIVDAEHGSQVYMSLVRNFALMDKEKMENINKFIKEIGKGKKTL